MIMKEDLQIGMPLTLKPLQEYDYRTECRVEAMGYDWVIIRWRKYNSVSILDNPGHDIEHEGWD